MKKTKISKDFIWDIVIVTVGTLVYAVGVHCFTAPHNIAPGGVTGIATMLNYLFGAHIGLTTFLINIPLLLLAWKFIGKSFFYKTLTAIALFTVMTDYVVVWLPTYTGGDNARILASVFGGVLSGAGLGLVFSRGYTTGGTDIITTMLKIRFPYFSTGKLLFLVDLTVVMSSVLVYGNLESALFALISMFAATKTMDAIIYGGEKGKTVLVISDRSEAIVPRILHELGRGATYLNAEGTYSHEAKKVLMIAVRNTEYHRLKKIVSEVDPQAFLIVLETSEITGNGFKPMIED